uniref:gluconate 2-dehydrogenase subunit 3 family protein n=3 Tax=Roseivirga sp. TaxID=1964215 RepID=UPI004048DF52
MDRRKALSLTATILGGSLVGSQLFLIGCAPAEKELLVFTSEDLAFLNEVADTIIPDTSSSRGAKAANIGDFMKTIVTDCYYEDEARIFYQGISKIELAATKAFDRGFMELRSEERFQLLNKFDEDARNDKSDAKFFGMMKELTLWGYFSSEIGSTEALRYNPVPGRFEGCIPYNNEPAWA